MLLELYAVYCDECKRVSKRAKIGSLRILILPLNLGNLGPGLYDKSTLQ
jgi:hypothetical protein